MNIIEPIAPYFKIKTEDTSKGRGFRKACTWLREHTSSLNYGFKSKKQKKKYPRKNTNTAILNALQDPHCWRYVDKISNDEFRDHFDRKETYFYEGNAHSDSRFTLFTIDIDCHDSGTLEGAVAFARYLRKKHFPSLYMEVSTEGNGIHGFVVLDKQGNHPSFVNTVLNQFEEKLRGILSRFSFDVENVEIKGTLPVITWSPYQKGIVSKYVSGQQAKFPRELHRFDELKNTTRLAVDDLQAFASDVVVKDDSLPPILGGKGLRIVGVDKPKGSTEGKIFHKGEVQKLDFYRVVAEKLMETHTLSTSNDSVVRVEDVAIWMMFMFWITNNMNADGTMPSERLKKFWQALWDSGDVTRAWNKNRCAVIFKYFSSLRLLEIEDNEYKVGFSVDSKGESHKGHIEGMRYVKGRAAKWKLSAEMMDMLEAEVVGRQEKKTIREEREAFSITCSPISISFIENLAQLPPWEVVRLVETTECYIYNFNPDEIGQYHGCLALVA